MDSDLEPESKLISLITQLLHLDDTVDSDPDLGLDSIQKFISCIIQIISLVSSIDLNSQPSPTSELMSLTSQTISFFNSMDFVSQPKPVKKVISLLWRRYSLVNSESKPEPDLDLELTDLDDDTMSLEEEQELSFKKLYRNLKLKILFAETLSLEPEPVLISLVHQIFSLVISVCPQVQVILEERKFHMIEEVSRIYKWKCLPFNWKRFGLPGEEGYTHFICGGCNGENHREYNKAPVEIKHPLHPKHYLQLVFLKLNETTRECYCCDEDLKRIFYYCSACDYAICFPCAKKPPVLSIDHPKWHEHALALFPSQASLTCSVCALTHSSCPFYICPPCDFVVHQKCISLPRVIQISRHHHRISFTLSLDKGDWSCGVCRRKIDNDYGSYSCIKKNCSYAAHSKCATQSNVWDGIELEGQPEDIEEEEVEPFVKISDGIIQHFSHEHHLILDENIARDYDENKMCKACVTPIYFGNFYSCVQCEFILHEECAKLSRKMYHPIHPHLLTLMNVYVGFMANPKDLCSVCPWLCKAGFFYECGKKECDFQLHVKCATISEPLVHESHMHPLFLTSKPEDKRRICSVCKEYGHSSSNETFNCIECEFSLCFGCATLPQKLRYKHDKHMLTLFYGEETSTMTYWCEACEGKINPRERFYICDEGCCVTLHIECMLGLDLSLKPSLLFSKGNHILVIKSNNHHMSRPICFTCEKRCPHKIVFHQATGSIVCSTSCLRD